MVPQQGTKQVLLLFLTTGIQTLQIWRKRITKNVTLAKFSRSSPTKALSEEGRAKE
jgi:hypothetical protein